MSDSEKKPCTTCGQIHEAPFNDLVMGHVEAWKASKTPEERLEHLRSIAEAFADSVDPSTLDTPEDYLTLLSEIETAYKKFDDLQLKLGRAVAASVDAYAKRQEVLGHLKEKILSAVAPAPKSPDSTN